jgi:NitT/TauT family transport system substrate-binding protein
MNPYLRIATRTRYVVLIAFLGALVCCLGCTTEPKQPLRIGKNPWPTYEFFSLAQEKGFFKDAGLDVRFIEFNSLSDARRAFERGQLDVFCTTIIEVLQARAFSKRSPQIVKVIDYSLGADVILSQKNLKTAETLRGARFGVELASLGVYVLTRGLQSLGLTLKDIHAINMDQLSMEEAFHAGKIDAMVSYPPTSVRLLRDNTVNTIFSTAQIPGEVIDVIAVDKEIHQQRSNDIRVLLQSFDRAVSYAQDHPEESYTIMAKQEGITSEEFAKAIKDGIVLVSAAEQKDYLGPNGKLAAIIDSSDRILRETNQISGPDHRNDSINPSYLEVAPGNNHAQ